MPAHYGSRKYDALTGIDPDAAAYCSLWGATDKQNISRWAKGIKALGLWSNFVCWMTRSSQAPGTGTTAPSFGGLGTFNATLVNGPTWGANGISLVIASSQSITFSGWPLGTGSITMGRVHNLTAISGNGDGLGGDNVGYNILGWGSPIINQTMILSADGGASGPRFYSQVGAFESIVATRRISTTAASGGGRRAYRNGALQEASDANSGALSLPTLGWISKLRTETLAMAFMLNTHVTDATAAQFNDLYKSTIGRGVLS